MILNPIPLAERQLKIEILRSPGEFGAYMQLARVYRDRNQFSPAADCIIFHSLILGMNRPCLENLRNVEIHRYGKYYLFFVNAIVENKLNMSFLEAQLERFIAR